MYNNLNLKSGNSVEIANVFMEILSVEINNTEEKIFINRGKELFYISISALTYLRDIKGEEITLKDVYNILHPDCLIAIIKDNVEEVLKDEELSKYAKFFIPESYIEESTKIHPKSMLKNIAKGLDYEDNMNIEEYNHFKKNHFFIIKSYVNNLQDLIN
jgi:hypothetical protein